MAAAKPELARLATSRGTYPKSLNLQVHGLRGFSALLVFIFHIYGMSNLWHFWPAALIPVNRFFDTGRYGVEIFFMISGYLITASLIRHQIATKFLIDRCIRIYPVFLTIHLLVFTVGPIAAYKWMAGISAVHWAEAFVSNALFLPGLLHLPLAQLNAWSLSYEAGFYLLSALVFVVARHASRLLAGIGLLAFLVPELLIFPIAAFFLPGVAVFFLTTKTPWKMPALFRWVSIPAVVAMLWLMTGANGRSSWVYLAVVTGFVFFWSIIEGQCALSHVLRARWLQYLGTISYSFYLWSPAVTYPVKILVSRVLHERVNNMGVLLVFTLISTVSAFSVSHVSYIYLEDRLGRFLRQRVYSGKPHEDHRREPVTRLQADPSNLDNTPFPSSLDSEG